MTPDTTLKRFNRLAAALLSAAGLLAAPAAGQAADGSAASPSPDQKWMREILAEDPACDEPTARRLSEAARRGIEREVWRREDSIRPPAPSGEMSCLADLMRSPQLDVFAPTQSVTAGMPGFIQGLLAQLAGGGASPFGDIDLSALAGGAADPTRLLSGSLCDFAERRWRRPTIPVLSGFAGQGMFAELPTLRGDPALRLIGGVLRGAAAAERGDPVAPSVILGITGDGQ